MTKFIIIIFLFSFFTLVLSGQTLSKKELKEYWKEIADDSKVVVVGTAEEYYRVIRPEKFKLNPDGSSPTEREIYVGMVFRVKITETLKGKIKTEKIGENKYANIFLYWVTGVPSFAEPKLFKGKEYVLFLETNNDKELESKETIEFKPNSEVIRNPFDYKSSYIIVHGFRGAVEIKTDKKKLIKEIKKAL